MVCSRFVNVYRLVKASLPPEEQETFLEENGTLASLEKNPGEAVL
ncbi:MAG TPA: hypothetical protein VIH54_11485 [Chthoniobacterales bacterium]|jgi:hypothetical protein